VLVGNVDIATADWRATFSGTLRQCAHSLSDALSVPTCCSVIYAWCPNTAALYPVAVVEQATERLCKNPSTGVDSPAKELLAFGLRIMLSHHCLFQLRKKIHIVITFPMDCAREHGAGACHHSVLLCCRDVGRGGDIQFVKQQVSVSGRWQITLTDCNQM